MESTNRAGLVVLGAALVLGIAGDALLRVTPWGCNIAIWTGLLAVAYVVAALGLRRQIRAGVAWLVVPFLAFAVALAVRDAPSLRCLNLLGLLAVVAFVLMRVQTGC